MAFSSYKTISEVLKAFQVIYTEANFIGEAEFNISDYFREDLEFTIREGAVDCSEFAICENLISPVLKQVWKLYSSKFILWSHYSLNYDEKKGEDRSIKTLRRNIIGLLLLACLLGVMHSDCGC